MAISCSCHLVDCTLTQQADLPLCSVLVFTLNMEQMGNIVSSSGCFAIGYLSLHIWWFSCLFSLTSVATHCPPSSPWFLLHPPDTGESKHEAKGACALLLHAQEHIFPTVELFSRRRGAAACSGLHFFMSHKMCLRAWAQQVLTAPGWFCIFEGGRERANIWLTEKQKVKKHIHFIF